MTKCLLLILCLLPVRVSLADEPLDLQRAIDLATKNSPSMIALQREKAAAEAEAQIEGQFGNPSLIAETTRSQPNYFVGAGYLWELGGKRSKRMAVARGAVQLAEINYRLALQTLRHDARLAYYGLLIARKKEAEVSQSRDLAQKLYDVAITRAIIVLAHTLQLNVIAEGVETQEQLQFLMAENCDEMQGFFFSRPIAPEKFLELVRSNARLAL